MMHTELAGGTALAFALPEYYFRVSREELAEAPGRFFSRLDRLRWEEM